MKYCSNLTRNHCVSKNDPQILSCINRILSKDGCDVNPPPFNPLTYIVIDGDALEAVAAIKSGRGLHRKAKSMDIAFGITNGSSNQIQLVELKFNCTTFYRLDKTSFAQKVSGTKSALGTSVNISSSYYIVFKVSTLQQGRRYLFRQNPRLNSNFKAVDINGLFAQFF
ncbi:MAG: hypothetical protein GY810_09110 [Aureispira sp.]|nr:hypothetical protein [Aureispira sp.]